MKKFWEFFDNLNEIVYMSDIDTNELIYMNKKTMESYGMKSLDEIKGKKCHELLQGSSTHCAFCNNHELEEGSFKEWQYYNPIVNANFLIKDTLIIDDGRRCRFELAINNNTHEHRFHMLEEQQNQEALANEGMRLALRASSPDKSIDIMLEYLGKVFNGERTYIFEKDTKGCDNNTYEWVASGVSPEKDNLQNLPPEVCAGWYKNFSEDKNIIIENVEDIKESDPDMYDVLKPQNIHSLVVVPLYDDEMNIGFYGVDNPSGVSHEYTQNMLQMVGHFIMSCLKRRDLYKQLEDMSYHDQLTKLGNRFAMDDYMAKYSHASSIGVVYCDITGLKRVNDTEGHKAGDRLIMRAAECFRNFFEDYGVFRIGGDELLAICPGIDNKELEDKAKILKQTALEQEVVLAMGAVWKGKTEGDIDKLLSEAEKIMYADKSAYYRNNGIDRRR